MAADDERTGLRQACIDIVRQSRGGLQAKAGNGIEHRQHREIDRRRLPAADRCPYLDEHSIVVRARRIGIESFVLSEIAALRPTEERKRRYLVGVEPRLIHDRTWRENAGPERIREFTPPGAASGWDRPR